MVNEVDSSRLKNIVYDYFQNTWECKSFRETLGHSFYVPSQDLINRLNKVSTLTKLDDAKWSDVVKTGISHFGNILEIVIHKPNI